MKNWKVILNTKEKVLAEVKIQRGIIPRDALSQLLLIITIISLSDILRKCSGASIFNCKYGKTFYVHGRHLTICKI